MSKNLEKKKDTTKKKKVVKEKSEKVEKANESKIKKLTKKQLIIIGSIFAACIVVVVISVLLLFGNKENETEVKTCLVQFNTNGGLEIEATNLECGATIKEPETPYKSGFDFLGWYLNGEEYEFESKVESNIVLEAKWQAKESVKIVVVSFDTDGGSKQADIEIEKGTYLVKPVDPTKKGYTFLGWYLDGKEFSFISKTIDKNIVLKAKWEKEKKKTEKDNTQNNTTTKNENNKNDDIDDNNDNNDNEFDVFNEYDNVVKNYSGTWYLNGYEDVFCIVEKKEYYNTAYMQLTCVNIDSNFKKVVYPPDSGGFVIPTIDIKYNEWDADLKENKMSLNSSYISINELKFVKNKGSKSRYDSTYYHESLGTWYMYNKPESKLYIEGKSDGYTGIQEAVNYDTVCIDGVIYGCDTVKNNKIFKDKGITIEGEILYLKINNDIYKFYRTKKVVKVSGIDLNKTSLKLNIDDSSTLSATINPSEAYDKSVTWSSSDTSIATVSNSGKVTAKGKGTATITVKTNDGGYTAKCIVTVTAIDVNSISLNKNSMELVKGNSETLTATITPSNANNKDVTWSSSDTSIATVSNSGKVTAKGKGTATITVKTIDGGYTAKCIVTVSNPPLTVSSSIGIKTIVSSGSMSSTITTRGVNASVEVSGGTGTYTYYYIKLYKEGKLIGSTTNTSSNELFVACGTNGSFTINGNYTMEYEVRDSDGTIKKGTSSSTISGF